MAPPKGHPPYSGSGRPKGKKNRTTVARDAGKARALKNEDITAERTMREIARLGFSDISRIFNENGTLPPLQTLPADVRATIASVKTLKTNVVSGDGQQEVTREVKLWDKGRSLELLAKHFGLVTERHEVTLIAKDLKERLLRGRARNAAET